MEREHVNADWFDSTYGTDTALIVRVGALDITSDKLEHTNRYEAVVPQVFDAMVRDLAVNYRDFVFIDVGCGKGRGLLLASRYAFKRVIGVEISRNLTERALENIHKFKPDNQQCNQIEVVCNDALNYDIPCERGFIYFYNPFDEQIMAAVLRRIEQSLQRWPRKIYAIYHRPMHRKVWDESSEFQLIRTAETYLIYESRSS
jgi:SAM-dependent methyltransferase